MNNLVGVTHGLGLGPTSKKFRVGLKRNVCQFIGNSKEILTYPTDLKLAMVGGMTDRPRPSPAAHLTDRR